MTHANIQRLADYELEKIDRARGALEQLRDDPTFVLLRDAELSGVTRQRWEFASAAVVSATSRLTKSRHTVNEAIRLLRANPPQPEEAKRMLNGRSVPLTPPDIPKEERRPPASSSSELRFTLHAVQDFVADDFRAAQSVVESVAAVLAAARPRLEQLTVRLDEADSRLGPAAASGTRAGLAALRRSLDDVWRLLAMDPLALSSGTRRAAELDELDRAVAATMQGAASQVAHRASEKLDECELLRGRLKIYRLRAARRGNAARPELAALYDSARQLLEANPRDLRLAEEAVRRYMEAEQGGWSDDEH